METAHATWEHWNNKIILSMISVKFCLIQKSKIHIQELIITRYFYFGRHCSLKVSFHFAHTKKNNVNNIIMAKLLYTTLLYFMLDFLLIL